MGGEASFLVEDFIDAITSQLDRVQDALRVKAVNRPLTYALKDLSLELKVFVELDQQGRVRFRTSSPTETGASVVHLGFTTITKPMIEENTVSLAVTRSPSLAEAGLAADERRRLERLGVRTVSQLENLNKSAGVSGLSRLADVPPDRLRFALGAGRPRIDNVTPAPPSSQPPAVAPPPQRSFPPQSQPPVMPPRFTTPVPPLLKPIAVAPSTRLQIRGMNLLSGEGAPVVKLNDQPLDIAAADDDELVVHIPHDAASGPLEVTLPDGTTRAFSLSVDDEWASPEVTR